MAEKPETIFSQIGTTVEWEIKDFRNLHPGNCQAMLSPTFWVYKTSWQIKIYPDGNLSSGKDYISIFVAQVRGSDPILATVRFLVKVNEDKIKEESFEFDVGANVFRGFDKYIERSELLKYLTPASSHSIKVVCSVHVSNNIKKDVCTQTLNLDKGVKNLTKNFEDFFLSENFSDVSFKVGSKDYPAHRALLAARSPVFSAMFEHEMQENISGVVDVIDCDSESFELFLKFLYTGNVDIPTNNVSLGLYKIADKHGLDDLKEICCDFMSECLEIDTICDVLELAITYEETELLKAAIEFFTVNAMNIFVTESWENFSVEKSRMGNKILRQMAANSKSKK